MTELTETQKTVLEFIRSFSALSGWPPTTREIQRHFKWLSQTAAINHLTALERKGAISRANGARTIRIIEP